MNSTRMILRAAMTAVVFGGGLAWGAMDVTTLMERHRQALSADPQAVQNLAKIQMIGSVQKYGIQGDLSIASALPDRFSLTLSFPDFFQKSVLTEKLKETQDATGWRRKLEGAELAEAQAIQFVLGYRYLAGLQDLRVSVDDQPSGITARFATPEGVAVDMVFDPASNLVSSFSFTGSKGRKRQFVYEAYRDFGGVRFPVKIREEGAEPAVFAVSEVLLSTPPETLFTMLDDVQAVPVQEKKPYKIPLEQYFGLPLVKCWIGDSPALTFLVDLGMPFSVVDRSIASQLGFTPQGSFTYPTRFGVSEFGVIRAPLFQLRESASRLDSKNRVFFTANMVPLCANVQKAIHGILGADFFHSCVVQLDLPTDSLYLSNPRDMKADVRKKAVPLNCRNGVFSVNVKMDDVAADLDVSTSVWESAVMADMSSVATAVKRSKSLFADALSTGLHYGMPERVFRVESMSVGDFPAVTVLAHIVRNPEGAASELVGSGWLGCGFWKRFSVSFNLAEGLLSLVPNDLLKAPDFYNTAGFYVVKSGGKIIVQQVVAGSAAEKAGIGPGDVLVALMDYPIDQFVFDKIYTNLSQAKGQVIPLKVQRGEETITVNLTTDSPL